MNQKNSAYYIKIATKIILSIICYLAFTFYTVPAYNNVKAYVEEKLILNKKTIVIGESSIFVEIVETEEERIKGLSGRKELLPNMGMFFIFDKMGKHMIWMKEMNFAIDVVWFNEFGEVIYIKENLSPDTYPESFGPDRNSKYILELPNGFIKDHGIKLGDTVDLL